mgnify:CR=1 FL=1
MPVRLDTTDPDFEAKKNRILELYAIADGTDHRLRLLQQALVHSSYAFEQSQGDKNNEKLEFLGDAVLDLVIGHMLCHRYGKMREGQLTRLRSSLVN